MCSAGVGRTGTLLSVDIALEQAAREGVIDIPSIVTRLREQRMKMVQTHVRTYVCGHICRAVVITTPVPFYAYTV